MNTETIISRIRKLTALANNNSNQHEAAAAMAKVQQLLAEHNLSMANIGDGDSKSTTPNFRPRTRQGVNLSAMYKYQTTLMANIAQNNFCYYDIEWRTKEDKKARSGYRTVKSHVLIGAEVNVVSASYMYEYLVTTMDRIIPYQGMEKRGKQALIWLEACVEALCERLNTQRREQEAEDAVRARGTNAVTLSSVHGTEEDLNHDFMSGWEPGTTAKRRLEAAARHAQWLAEIKARPMSEPPPDLRTEEQKRRDAKREAHERERQERAHARAQARYSNAWRKEMHRRSSDAFQSGLRAGYEDISLNRQIEEKE